MNKKPIIIAAALVFLLVILVWFMDSTTKSRKKNYFSNWSKIHQINSKEPKGLFFFKELIEKHTMDTIIVATKFSELKKLGTKADSLTYIFIGNEIELGYYEWNFLTQKLDSGATGVFVFPDATSNIFQSYFKKQAFSWEYSNDLYAWIDDTTLRYVNEFQNDTIYGDWWLYNKNAIKDTAARAYAFALNQPIAFYQNQHKGVVHLHCNPRFFENYQVRKPAGLAYLRLLIKRLPKDRQVVFLNFARKGTSDTENKGNESGTAPFDDSLIQFLLRNPKLKAAFLALLFLSLLYAIFRSKRMEPEVPYLPKPENVSLSFVQTISSIFISKNNPVAVLKLMRKNFFLTINRYFFIDLNAKDKLDDQIKRLGEKSNFDADKLEFLKLNLCKRPKDLDPKHLQEINKVLREFYLSTGIIKKNKYFLLLSQEIVVRRTMILGLGVLLIAFLLLFRGAFLLTTADGIGSYFLLVSFVFFALGGRLIARPILEIKTKEIYHYNFFYGKKVYSLEQELEINYTKDKTTFVFENNLQFSINNFYIGMWSKKHLLQFINFIKNKAT